MTSQRGGIYGFVVIKGRVTDQEVWPAGQRHLGARAENRFLVLFRKIKQGQELKKVF